MAPLVTDVWEEEERGISYWMVPLVTHIIRGILRSKMGLLRKMYNQNNFIRTNRIQDDDVNHGG